MFDASSVQVKEGQNCAGEKKKAELYILKMSVKMNMIQNQLRRKDKTVEKRAGI